MAKDITLKTRNGETRYPKSVTALIYENGTGKTLQTIIDEMRQVDTQTNTRTQHFKADVTSLDTLKNKTDIGLYNYVGTGWRGSVSVCYDSADNVSQVALSSSTPSYNGNTLTWLSAQPCAMARTYTNGAWSHWKKVGASVVNDLTTGGTDKALSAEMGKTLKEGLDALGPKIGETLTASATGANNNINAKIETALAVGDKIAVSLATDSQDFSVQVRIHNTDNTFTTLNAVARGGYAVVTTVAKAADYIHAVRYGSATVNTHTATLTLTKGGVKAGLDETNLKIETIRHRRFNLFAIDSSNPLYTNELLQIDNAVKELYIKNKVAGLKIGVFRKNGVLGATQSRFIVWNSSTQTFYVDITESNAVGTKLYSTANYLAVIDWDKVTFNLASLTSDIYLLSDDVFSPYYSVNLQVKTAKEEIEGTIDSSVATAIAPFSTQLTALTGETAEMAEALTQDTTEVGVPLGVEVGGFTVSGTYNDNVTNRFRVHDFILAANVKSISVASEYADTYDFYVWGNDLGYGNTIDTVATWRTEWTNTTTKKYVAVLGRRKDDATLTSADLEILATAFVAVEEVADGYKKCATLDDIAGSNPKGLIVVDAKGGGHYTSLQEAIIHAGDDAAHPKTILVMPGTYVMDAYDSNTRSLGNNRYLSIIGTDKHNCIVRNDKGYYNTNPYYDNGTLKLQGNVYLANLTIINTDDDFEYPEGITAEVAETMHKAYCVHFDFGATTGTTCEIHNCILINDHFACVGCGNKGRLIFSDCMFKLTSYNPSDKRGCIYTHDHTGTGKTELIVKNCILESDYYCIYAVNAYNQDMELTFIGNVAVNDSGNVINSLPSNFVKTNKCFGNNDALLNYGS